MKAAIIFCILLLSCEEAALRERSRPSEDGVETPGFDLETTQSVKANQSAVISISDTTVTIPENSLAEDTEVRLRRLIAKPEHDSVASLGEAKGDVIELVMYNKQSDEIYASSLLAKPIVVSQTLRDVSDESNLKYVAITAQGTENELVQVLSRKAITASTALIGENLNVTINLNSTHVTFYGVESDADTVSVTILDSGEDTTNDSGGTVANSSTSSSSHSSSSSGGAQLSLQTIFVAPVTNGDLDGLDGADQICQAAANSASFGGTWKAILSYSGEPSVNAKDRLTISGAVYNNAANAQKVFNDSTDMWSGTTPEHSLAYQPDNSPSSYVFSNTSGVGTAEPSGCQNWGTNSTSFYGGNGIPTETNADNYWIISGSRKCDKEAGIYCINGQSAPLSHTIFIAPVANGNLGGLAGADAICQVAADASSMGGSWKAILSDNSTNAKDRLTINGPIYNNAPDPLEVFDGATDMWGDTEPVELLNYSADHSSSVNRVFTGSDHLGNTIRESCDDWSVTGIETVMVGDPSELTGQAWINQAAEPCASSNYGIYCINQ